ncbi:MAG: PAS domain S-box protein [Euryarchaeota archaeon]|nr:PAS domain S-box protein [Euryarchaeota archaeon]
MGDEKSNEQYENAGKNKKLPGNIKGGSNDKSVDPQNYLKRIYHLKSFSEILSIVILIGGCLVLIGWAFNVPILKSPSPSFSTIKSNMGLCFILIGISLCFLQTKRTDKWMRRVAQVCAIIVALIGFLTLIEYLFNINLYIDQMLFNERPGAIYTSSPNRIAFTASLNLFITGIALLLLDRESIRSIKISQFFAGVVSFISLLAIIGYLYGVSALYYIPQYTGMAIYTAITLFLVSLSTLFARPDQGFMSILTRENFGGYVARRLLPVFIIIPILMGWLGTLGEKAEVYGPYFGESITILLNIVLFTVVIWWGAYSFNKIDREREKAEKELREYKDHLEDLVEERTDELKTANLNLQKEIEEHKKSKEHISHLNSVLSSVRNINQLIVRERNEKTLLQKACEILTSTRGFRLVWIGKVKEGSCKVLPVASAGFEVDYLDSVEITCDDSPTGQGPTGTAIKTRKPSVVLNIASNPLFRPWRDQALKRGYVSSVSVPIMVGEQVYGALTIYSDRVDVFDHEEVLLIEELGVDIGFGLLSIQTELEREKMQNALKMSEEKHRTLFESMAQGVVYQDSEGNITSANPAAERILGLTLDQMQGRTSMDPRWRAIHEDGSEFPGETHPSMLALKTGEKVKNTIMGVFNPKIDGYLWININAIPQFRPDEDQPYQVYITFDDITELKEAEMNIKKALEEKEILLREIHHRVKNNMQIISSLLNLQSGYIQDERDLEFFKESQSRVKSMAMIHEKLYQSEDLASIDYSDYIKSFVADLSYMYTVDPHLIKVKIDVEKIRMNIDTAIPLGLIINELVTNSIKHAFPKGRKGEISVKLFSEGDKLTLTISDNGIGFPEDLDISKTDTLGLKLVNNLIRQVDGKIELDRSHGTEFKIIFKELKYEERM